MTIRRSPAILALLLALTSCQGVAPGKPGVGASAAPRPSAKAVKPGGPVGAAAITAPATVLRPPQGPAASLSGQVLVDERYATSQGGASRLVGADGATLVGMDGATLVAGGRIAAAGAGNIVVPAALVGAEGALLIGADGASLIGADGASLIGADGASLIGADGASLGAGSPAGYALAQAPAAFGEQRPAAGMWVSVVDARTGLTVPLGTDAAGGAVHTVYTDAEGRFTVNIDPALKAHVRVVARAPGRRDPRLVLNVITAAGAEERRIDETEASVTRLLRTVAANRMEGYLGLNADATQAPALDTLTTVLSAVMAPVKRELELAKAGPNGDALVHELCLLVADRILLETGYENLKLTPGENILRHPEGPSLAGKPVVAELRGVVDRLDKGTRARLGDAPDAAAYFASKRYMIAANLGKAPPSQYVIERPGDMVDLVAREYLSSVRPFQDEKYADIIDDLGLSLLDRDRVTMAGPSLFDALTNSLTSRLGEGDIVEDLARIVRDARLKLANAAPPPAPAPRRTAPPASEPPAEPPRQVETIVGVPGVAGATNGGKPVDGPGASAYLTQPFKLALDERSDPPVLYVSEAGTNAIRRITFDAAGQATASTLAGTAGKLKLVRGLVFDGKGSLYAASDVDHSIHRIDLAADGASGVVTRVAGTGTAGWLDGPGDHATFNAPNGLALSPTGDLVVADALNNRLRRIALDEPGFPVSTLLGNGRGLGVAGPLAPAPAIPGAETQGHPGAMPEVPNDVCFEPGGALLYLEFTTGMIRRVAEPFSPGARAELVAGGRVITGFVDGFYHNSGFKLPATLALDPKGRIVVAGNLDHRIRLVTPDGWVRTLAGGGPIGSEIGSHADGPGDQARFYRPSGVAVAKDGTIYVADSLNHVIRRIKP